MDEKQYLDLLNRIICSGDRKEDRTGAGTLSLFGYTAKYSLRNGTLPLLTTKRVPFRLIAEELLWMIRGCTDAKALQAKNVNIWNGNSSKEFLKKMGFDRQEGDCGPIYGFQWRHWGAEYVNCNTSYDDDGIDQLKLLIDKIKTNPNDRRLILSAWNVSDLNKMVLPPCHCFAQFYVSNGELTCVMYQRSVDMCLGAPFNIASYSLLTHMIAHVTGLKARELVHMMGDTHVYLPHIDSAMKQVTLEPFPFPILEFTRSVQDIDDFCIDDFNVVDYNCHPTIKFEMMI